MVFYFFTLFNYVREIDGTGHGERGGESELREGMDGREKKKHVHESNPRVHLSPDPGFRLPHGLAHAMTMFLSLSVG
ncbi:unnamed protein product [Periconia digitata]|uniref:Uncharacterized protein n=1 Tax=Periconia digitata TaxID=1303443 RepID=A0A9W4U6Y0_9PLEO|nr:unnamed protein product [Periconia digitata]